jgi:Predicted amidophosphoribosyltransferases
MSANQNSQDHVGRIASPPHRGLWATLGEGFAQILYPRWCPVCHTLLSPAAPPLCLSCQSLLSDYHEETIHALDRLRGARIAPRRLLAPYLYAREGSMQKIIHDIKYHGNKSLARYMGQLMGISLPLTCGRIDYIIPIPLTYKRALHRGYNQTILLAEGISSVTGISYLPHALRPLHNHSSQTDLDRPHRLTAMLGSFVLGRDEIPPGSHILLLDDVLTTGATLTAALEVLALRPQIQVTVAVLAVSTPTN